MRRCFLAGSWEKTRRAGLECRRDVKDELRIATRQAASAAIHGVGKDFSSVNALGICPSSYGVDRHGLVDHCTVYWNLPAAQVYEHTVRASLGTIASNGALVVNTGKHTGRSPNDKFIVEEHSSKDDI